MSEVINRTPQRAILITTIHCAYHDEPPHILFRAEHSRVASGHFCSFGCIGLLGGLEHTMRAEDARERAHRRIYTDASF